MGLLYVETEKATDYGTVQEITCSGLARVEFIGGGLGCFVFYRNAIDAAGRPERQICGRLFAPLEAMPAAIHLMCRAVAVAGVEIVERLLPN